MATFEQFLSDLLDIAKAPSASTWLFGNSARRLQLLSAILASSRAEHRVRERADVRVREASHLARMASVAGLTSSFAHELNQPLTAILSNAQTAKRLAADEHPDLRELREILQEIATDAMRTGKLVRQMYGLMRDTCESAYYAGPRRHQPESFDPPPTSLPSPKSS